jgi:hypothetical protein
MRAPLNHPLTPADAEDAAAGLAHDDFEQYLRDARLASLADRLVLVIAGAAVFAFLLAAIFLGY